jgi:hypothetical protein
VVERFEKNAKPKHVLKRTSWKGKEALRTIGKHVAPLKKKRKSEETAVVASPIRISRGRGCKISALTVHWFHFGRGGW